MIIENNVLLMVEDNADHAELILRCLEEHPRINKILHLADGEAAISYMQGLNEYSDRDKYPLPNVILLDLRIPKVDGLQVLKNIKEDANLKHIPIIILSSSESDKDIVSAYKNNANSYLVKPLDYDKFTILISQLDFYWLNLNKSNH